MSAWETMVATRSYALRIAIAMAGLALISTLFLAIGLGTATCPIAVVFSLLSGQAFTAYALLGKIADLQAAIDMMRIAKGEEPE